MDDPLAAHLARQARALKLHARNVDEASPETVLTFARAVLAELAALGLLEGEEEVSCWAAPRPRGN